MGQFITPPTIPDDTYCRRILIPNSPQWIGAITGALLPLIYSSEWVSTGGISPDEAAQRALQMFNEYVNSGNNGDCGDMSCCDEKVTIQRFNPTTGRPEISTDGGITWTPDPADIQNQIKVLPPLVTSTSGKSKCDAATNASSHVNELITATAENLTTASNVFALAVGIAEAILALFLILASAGTLTAPVTAVATAIWAASTSLFALGISAYNAYWTVDKQDAILCALFCAIGENGQFTEAQYQKFRSEVLDTLPSSPALDIVMTSINAGGARGLTQMASYGNAAESDCASCDCDECADFNFLVSDGGWVSGALSGNPGGAWGSGSGWMQTYVNTGSTFNNLVNIQSPVSPCVGSYDIAIGVAVDAVFGEPLYVRFSLVDGYVQIETIPSPIAGTLLQVLFNDITLTSAVLNIRAYSRACDFRVTSVTIVPHV